MKVLVDHALLARICYRLKNGHPVPEVDIDGLSDVLAPESGWTRDFSNPTGHIDGPSRGKP
jgi:hypothetical protein